MIMSAICTNETTDSIENIDKVKIVFTIEFQNASLCLALLFKLASYCFAVSSYPLSDITVYMPISSTHTCMTRAPEFHVTL